MKTFTFFKSFASTSAFFVLGITCVLAQVKVGANPGTINGGSALEIEASDKGLLMPRVVLTNTTTWGLSGTAVAGMSVYNTSSVVGSTNAAYPATGVGEYYWDGTGWVSKKGGLSQLGADNGLMVGYNSVGNVGLGGALSKNTVVEQGTNTLAFTSTATSGTSHFTVDGSTFNVDALNGRVSINNLAPKSFLHISTKTAGASIDAGIFSINNCGGSCTQGTARNIVLNNTNGSNDLFASLDFVPSIDPTAPSGASIQGIDRNLADLTTNYAGLAFFTRNATNYAPRMVIKSSGNVGIGTTSPGVKLEVNSESTAGAVKIVDGTQGAGKVLMSDANGVGTWQTPASFKAVVLGSINTTSRTVTSSSLIGSSITLSKGKWLVNIGQLVTANQAATATKNKWIRIRVSSSNSSISYTGFNSLGADLVSGWLGPAYSISDGQAFSMLTGVLPIEVTSSSLTLYTWFDNVSVTSDTSISASVGSNGENYLFAVPIN